MMKCLPICLFLVLFVLNQVCQGLLGNILHDEPEKNGESRIIGGTKANPGEFPFMVALYVNSSLYCTGSLVAANWVLTASHCTAFKDITALVGSVELVDLAEANEEDYEVVKVIDIKRGSALADIALLKLERNVSINDNANIIALQNTNDYVPNTAKACGWGTISDAEETASSQLMCVDLTIISNSQCKKIFGLLISSNHICTQDNRKGVCRGDDGGPLFLLNQNTKETKQIGIFSFMGATCESGAPFVFVRVSHYYDWIQDTIAPNNNSSTFVL